ncbi:hypothetical protein [Pseudomonas sp. efr-133-TYG-5]|jgi:YVTN family beta-propeller protein|uniref:YncE family protein n=1 Tax=Pseudomonas sp. efr-133-TYG-5 TaxID=3040310 RepID=UPI002554213B|nr:hypothetical protein [Pseudomonas sp. efr-133-TYG-5]
MTTQNPQIEIVTSHPGGTVIKSGDTTTSKAIEMVGSGTPHALYVITDNGEEVASGEYNGSGRFINRFDNLEIREHLYELRENASLPPTSVWKVYVAAAGGPLGPIPVSPTPYGICLSPDGNRAFVCGFNSVQVIDTTSSTLIDQIPVPLKEVSWEMAISPDGARGYVCSAAGALTVIDLVNSRYITDIPLQSLLIGIVLSADGAKAFVTTWGGNTVVVVDTASLQAIKTIAVGRNPRGIDISPDGTQIYVANWNNGGFDGSISVIDIRTLAVTKTFALRIPAYGVAVTPDGRSLYVCGADGTQGAVVQIDANSGQLLRDIPVLGNPRGVIVNHGGTQVLCCNESPQMVSVIDTASGTVSKLIPVGKSPLEIKISADDSRAFVVCANDPSVFVISLLPGASGIDASDLQASGILNASPQPRTPLPGDAY